MLIVCLLMSTSTDVRQFDAENKRILKSKAQVFYEKIENRRIKIDWAFFFLWICCFKVDLNSFTSFVFDSFLKQKLHVKIVQNIIHNVQYLNQVLFSFVFRKMYRNYILSEN